MKKLMMMCAFALLAVACSPEQKAADAIADYETKVFAKCKEITAEQKMDPGTHYCSKVGSMALDMSLKKSGLDEAAWKKMVTEWQANSELGKYYADEKARELIAN